MTEDQLDYLENKDRRGLTLYILGLWISCAAFGLARLVCRVFKGFPRVWRQG
jgi:hypothetical protein